MNTTVSSNESQAKQLLLKGVDAATLANCHADVLVGILSAITKLSQDDTITKLASHGKDIATTLSDDMDYCQEEIEKIGLGVWHE